MLNNENFSASNFIFNGFLLVFGVISALVSYYFINFINVEDKICIEENMIITEWSECRESNTQTRTAQPLTNCQIPADILLQRSCTPSTKRVYLYKNGIKEYSTKINFEDSARPYIENHNNLQIIPTGVFKSAVLHVRIETTIFDGRPYKIPEFYYLFFGFEDEILKVLGTSRIKDNRLDLNEYGVFQGTETPKELSFDLENTKLANPSDTNLGSETGKYVSRFLNTKNGVTLNMTLFVADGRSMTEPDEMKRIYGTITDAYIEYMCEDDECSIERIPQLPI